jgi:Uma2 family endonuclease
MGMPAEIRRWTADEVRDLQDESRPWPRYELIAGELLVTPAPRRAHQRAAGLLFTPLAAYVEAERLGEALLSPADLELEPYNITQPDLFVVPSATNVLSREWTDVHALLLAVEVLSPGSAQYDRTTKRMYYQRVGVPEYWVVDLDARVIERWRPGDDRPETLRALFALDLPTLFARVLRDGAASRGEWPGDGPDFEPSRSRPVMYDTPFRQLIWLNRLHTGALRGSK